MNGFLGHVFIGACKRLESLIGMRIGFSAQDGLDGLCHDSPRIVEVLLQLLGVENQFAQTFQCALNGDNAMAERHTDVAQHRRVGQVALQTAYWQFLNTP